MNVSEWLASIKSLNVKQIDLSLERVIEVCGRLGLLKPKEPVITVAGTNGKGSCVSGLEAVYLAAGYRVGTFTSPFLFKYNEQVRIQGQNVTDDMLCEAFSIVHAACEDIALTPFEFGTLAALVIFEQANLDIRILEVGLGGRFDAVNAIDADLALVTSISIDHTEWLGTTRESISYEKAGIFRRNRPAICGDMDPPKPLIDYANTIGSPLFCQGRHFGYQADATTWTFMSENRHYEYLPIPTLALQNMASVLMAIELLQPRLSVSRSAIDKGLRSIQLNGRIQVTLGAIQRIVDVSHNPASVDLLAQHLKKYTVSGKTRAVFSMLADKDILESIRAIQDVIDEWYVAPLSCDRAATHDMLMYCFRKAQIKHVNFFETIEQAHDVANASAIVNDRIVVFGSFHTVASCAVKPNEAAIL